MQPLLDSGHLQNSASLPEQNWMVVLPSDHPGAQHSCRLIARLSRDRLFRSVLTDDIGRWTRTKYLKRGSWPRSAERVAQEIVENLK